MGFTFLEITIQRLTLVAAGHPSLPCHPERSAARLVVAAWGRVGRRAVEGPLTNSVRRACRTSKLEERSRSLRGRPTGRTSERSFDCAPPNTPQKTHPAARRSAQDDTFWIGAPAALSA